MVSLHAKHSNNESRRSGFTLVEIMIVVVIIGLLATLAFPAYKKVREQSQAKRLANDYRTFAGTFEFIALELGAWPVDGVGNNLPLEAQPYFESSNWYNTPPNGGFWDWEVNRHGFVASIGLSEGSGLPDAVYQGVDELLDDGNLSTGLFRRTGGYYLYILQAN